MKYLVVDRYLYIRSKKISLYKELDIDEITTVQIFENNQSITLQSGNTYHYSLSDSQSLVNEILLVNSTIKVYYK